MSTYFTQPDQSGQGDPHLSTKRVGTIAIVGRPNVGKSTLLNVLLGEKLSIVSERPQTTRNRILGIRTIGDDQLVFIDTPGIHQSKTAFNRFMVRQALSALEAIDALIFVTEMRRRTRSNENDRYAQGSDGLHPRDAFTLEQIRQRTANVAPILAINKIDLLRDHSAILPMIETWRQAGFDRIVPLSARSGSGIDRLVKEIRSLLRPGDHRFPADALTDRAQRFLASELVREQVFRMTRQEIPYGVAVDVERFEETPHGTLEIDAAIFVEREGQKGIIVGHQGETIKTIGTRSRIEIQTMTDQKVYLSLVVRVAKNWTGNSADRQRFGYE